MSPVNVPTDSLHKFCAIVGLIVIGFSFYFPLQKYNEASIHKIEAASAARTMRNAYWNYTQAIDMAAKNSKRYLTQSKKYIAEYKTKRSSIEQNEKGPVPPELAAKLEDSLDDAASSLSEVTQPNLALQKISTRAAKKEALSMHFATIERLWLIIGFFGFFTGIAAAIWGFKTWIETTDQARSG